MRRSVLSAARKATAQSQVRKLTYDECAQERSKKFIFEYIISHKMSIIFYELCLLYSYLCVN